MKRSFFILTSIASGAALSLGRDRVALAAARVRAIRIARGNVRALGAVPGGCATHRSARRWSGYSLRDVLG